MSSKINLENQDDVQVIHQFYQDIISSLPNIVYLLDKDCTLVGGNNNFLTMLGLTHLDELEENFYQRLVTFANWSEERAQLLKRDDINALLSDTATYDSPEKPVLGAEGKITYYLATRVPLFSNDKKNQGLLVVLMDVSEKLLLTEQLKKIKEQLQLSNAQPAPTSVASHINMSKNERPSVLLVEDNRIAQKAGQALLMQFDCKVEVAPSEGEVANLFKPGKYDIVFMDISLEDTSGYVMAKKIRQMEQNTAHHVPIIALTGYQADVVKYDCDDYFMEGAITKPLTSEQVKQIIQHYVYHIDIPISGLRSIKTAPKSN
ncbi:sensory box sensor histidine kinase/response regulator [Legionella beliardensis]|uniref:Sensory box sensor histidine kinase/response regulator n=1 Tax=Legionella beliardensis TaxID=91822 RepID=A0A378I8J5_9GAMM|nr:response regulator [Legionella beliardensis]STX28694.1 sensory box sensor histidine kinase/response regulator [Legionella beliardensis]